MDKCHIYIHPLVERANVWYLGCLCHSPKLLMTTRQAHEQKGLAPEDRVVFFMERDEANDMIRRYTHYQKLAKYQRNP
ncbi:hypothetical protein NC653_007997 [Populus alba x Populus x berolinensis]|uniref:Uncharacterized protein n=1 Tax=Populus alba x Populus x berolinensis TaxID=444605 RepID=A0AAD6R5M0_9ROSI|nr:hypothetical protein NC653_007997 [Populus alba x Populus x berolinensis]